MTTKTSSVAGIPLPLIITAGALLVLPPALLSLGLTMTSATEVVIYAILSHADYLQAEYPRKSRLDKTLYACDELCGFIVACALMRPERLVGMTAKSVRKKMKQASFAASVSRDDIIRGAADLGVDLDEHINFVISHLQPMAEELDLLPVTGSSSPEAG